jgi:hypothetical protein
MQHYDIFQFQELGRQRLPDEEENIFDCHTTELGSGLSAGSTVRKELNDFRKNKSDTNQLDRYDTVEQNALLPSATVSHSVLETGSIQNINSSTAATKENDCTAYTKQNTIPSKVTNSTVTATPSSSTTVIASGHSISNVTAATKQCGSTFIPQITTKQNTATASEQTVLTVEDTSILPTSFVDESYVTMTAASESFTGSAKQNKKEDAKIIADHLKAASKVGTDSLKHNSNTASEPLNQSDKVTGGKVSSPMAFISEYFGTSDENQDHGHIDLQKVESKSIISDMDTEMLCISNCDTELEFYMSVINKDLEHNLKLTLMSVLKKEIGESASQILAPSVMGVFKKELSYMMQQVMVKALSSVIDNVTESKNQDSHSHCEGAAGVTRISSMVQEWKEELMLVTNSQRVEKEKEMAKAWDRTEKYGERMSELYCNNMASTKSNWEDNNNGCNSRDSIDRIDNDYNNGTKDKNTLVGSVQDFMQLQNVTDCQMMGIPRSVSDQGTQTISTGCILYLKCLHDL